MKHRPRVLISNYIHIKLWDVIIHLRPKLGHGWVNTPRGLCRYNYSSMLQSEQTPFIICHLFCPLSAALFERTLYVFCSIYIFHMCSNLFSYLCLYLLDNSCITAYVFVDHMQHNVRCVLSCLVLSSVSWFHHISFWFNALASGRRENNFKIVIFKLMLLIDISSISLQVAIWECHRTPLVLS